MYVCICNAVTDGDIRQAARKGIATMDDLCEDLKVATCCGRCRDCARKHLSQAVFEQGAINAQGAA